ncbi:MAG: ABC transporter substrate-binding protein [Burkholderiaceae bacterium]|nr:ABC transporter substrate-binding protein [Burkholderiaceae bacterium]
MITKSRKFFGVFITATTLTMGSVAAYAAGGTLNVGYDSQPATLDAQSTTVLFTREISRTFYETLVTLNEEYQPVPHLAESINASDDRKTYTFNLRQGVMFHNGEEMKSEDVVASMNRWMEVNSGARRFFDGSTFEQTGDYTVVLTMPEAKVDTLHVLASWNSAVIMPKEVVDGAGADENGVKEFIGTGPFKFVEWRQDQYVHVERNDNYQSLNSASSGFSGQMDAMVDEIYFRFVPDTATRAAGLQSGQYDIAMRLSSDDFPRFDSNPNIGVATSYNGFLMMNYNNKEGVFADLKMRQAVNTGINPTEILQGAYANEEFYELNASYNIKDQTDWYTTSGDEFYNQNDPEKAKALLAEAGYDGEEVILLVANISDWHTAAIIIQAQLQNLGMNVKIEAYDFPTYGQRRLDSANYDIAIQPFSLNPIPTQWIFFNPQTWGWTDDAELLDMVSQMQNGSIEEAKALWPAAHRRSWEYLPITKIGDTFTYSAYNSQKVQGFTTFDQSIFWNVSVSE